MRPAQMYIRRFISYRKTSRLSKSPTCTRYQPESPNRVTSSDREIELHPSVNEIVPVLHDRDVGRRGEDAQVVISHRSEGHQGVSVCGQGGGRGQSRLGKILDDSALRTGIPLRTTRTFRSSKTLKTTWTNWSDALEYAGADFDNPTIIEPHCRCHHITVIRLLTVTWPTRIRCCWLPA